MSEPLCTIPDDQRCEAAVRYGFRCKKRAAWIVDGGGIRGVTLACGIHKTRYTGPSRTAHPIKPLTAVNHT